MSTTSATSQTAVESSAVKRALLIQNPNSRSGAKLDTERLLELLDEAGYRTQARFTETVEELDAVVTEPGDLLVIAGGDGSVRAVAQAMAARSVRTPLAILPVGTANNIAGTLGLTADLEDFASGLRRPRRRRLDLGRVRAPWGEELFMEAAGFGLFANALHDYVPAQGKSPWRALQTVISVLAEERPRPFSLLLDGEDLSGDYLMVEVMNTSSCGPRLHLAPDADPADGEFDVVLVQEAQRLGIVNHLRRLLAGEIDELPNVSIHRGRELRLQWRGEPLHLDENVFPPKRSVKELWEPGEVSFAVDPGALEVWLPEPPEQGR